MADLSTVEVPAGDGSRARVEYEDIAGDPALAPVLFLHEGLGSVALWRGFHQRIAAATGRRAVAYSRLGHGDSDPPPTPRTASFMHEEAATVVPALCATLGVERPVLVGHSDGASIALIHAATHPVRGVAVLAPHVFVEEVGLRGVAMALQSFIEGDLRARMARRHRDPDAAFHNWNDVWLSAEFRRWDLRPLLGAVTVPVLGVQGTDDPYGTIAHVDAVRAGVPGRVELLVLDCGHAPHLELPEQVEAAVTTFLTSLP